MSTDPKRITPSPVYPDIREARPFTEADGSVTPAAHPEYAFLPEARVQLTFPITLGGMTVSELSIRRPKVKDNKYLNTLKGSDGDKSMAYLAHLTGMAPDEFDQLDISDVAALGEWLELFVSARKRP